MKQIISRCFSNLKNFKSFLSNNEFIIFGCHFFFLILFTLYFVFNKDWSLLPQPDFFSYLRDGAALLNSPFSNPELIHHPFYSVLVVSLTRIFSKAGSEMYAGIVINIFLFFLTNLLFIRIFIKKYRFVNILMLLLVGSSFITYQVTLLPENIPLLAFFLILSLWLISRDKLFLAHLVAGLSYLVRPEGIAIILGVFLMQRRKYTTKNVILPSILFIFFILFEGNKFLSYEHKDRYISETFENSQSIPNWHYFYETFSFLSPKNVELKSLLILTVFLVVCCYLIKYRKTKNEELAFLTIFGVIYSLMHFVFPGRDLRYSYPMLYILIPILFFPFIELQDLLKNRKINLALWGVITILTSILLIDFNQSNNWWKGIYYKKGDEFLAVGSWINKNINHNTLIISDDLDENLYFINNNSVQLLQLHKQYCDTLQCILLDNPIDNNFCTEDYCDLLIIVEKNFDQSTLDLSSGRAFLKVFKQISDFKCFVLETTIDSYDNSHQVFKLTDWKCLSFNSPYNSEYQ